MSERASECFLAPRYTRFIAFTSKNEEFLSGVVEGKDFACVNQVELICFGGKLVGFMNLIHTLSVGEIEDRSAVGSGPHPRTESSFVVISRQTIS